MRISSERISVGLEECDSGHVHVHALTIPGCVATGHGTDEALRIFQSILPEWLTLLADLGEPMPSWSREIEITVDEWVFSDIAVATGESSALFDADRAPLTDGEIRRGLSLLGAFRARLLPLIRHATNQDLDRSAIGETDVRLVLDEMARAHWWILTRLGASPLALVPERIVSRLDTAMALIVQHLGDLPADARDRVLELEGERWTPRKVLRRLLWIEWALGGTAIRALGHTPVSAA